VYPRNNVARPSPVRSACAGLSDFILLPSTALALGPRAFVVELGRGTGSLAGNLSRGTLMSFASFWYGQSERASARRGIQQ